MDKIMGVYIYILKRCKEPSTYAALSALMTSAGLSVETGFLHNIIVLLGVAFGSLGFFIKEAKPLTIIDDR
jgi:hypothetical protein